MIVENLGGWKGLRKSKKGLEMLRERAEMV